MDRQEGLGIRRQLRSRRRDAGARSCRAGVRGAGHLCRRLCQRDAGPASRQHAPHMDRRRQAAREGGRQRPARRLHVADPHRAAKAGRARLQPAGHQRPERERRAGRQEGQRVHAQGRLSLRLGLGAALRHVGHMAAGRLAGVERRADQRPAYRSGQPDAGKGRPDRRVRGHGRGGGSGHAGAARRRRRDGARRGAPDGGPEHGPAQIQPHQTEAMADQRPRRSASLQLHRQRDARRRHGQPRRPHGPAHPAHRADARRRRDQLLCRAERRPGLHEGRQLHPQRQLPAARDLGNLCARGPVRRRHAHEHDPRLGRRRL